ncbi:type II secretion system protein GspC [Ningiella sp. W23]|uniref:type II secretion system protein GspC n=1 Tax=Ningiella sp. W23 TaxID=3023715 RepID=UPI0037568612
MAIEKVNLAPALRFYQQNDKYLILLVVILLALYLIAFAAKLTWQLIPEPQVQQSSGINSTSLASTNNSNSNRTSLDRLLALNLFGDASAQPVVEQAQDITEAPETQLNLVLSGVAASSDPSDGAAVIEYQNNQSTYGIGDKIDGTQVTLDEIYADRVIIKNRATRETLMLEGIDFDEANRDREQNTDSNQTISTDRRFSAPPALESEDLRQVPRADAQTLRAAQQRLQEDPASFADYVRLSPVLENGGFVGYRIAPGKEPSLFEQVGLKNGDVVIELNGYDLTDVAQAKEAITLLNDAESLDFEILRDENVISISVEMPRFPDDSI